jgi:hypothetical protein
VGWCYDRHFCYAKQLRKRVDFVTGKEYNIDKDGYVTADKHPFCKDINSDGLCTMYVDKEGG